MGDFCGTAAFRTWLSTASAQLYLEKTSCSCIRYTHRVVIIKVIKAEGTSCQFSYCLLSACSNLECPLKGISGISAVLNLKGKECKFSPYAIYFMYFR